MEIHELHLRRQKLGLAKLTYIEIYKTYKCSSTEHGGAREGSFSKIAFTRKLRSGVVYKSGKLQIFRCYERPDILVINVLLLLLKMGKVWTVSCKDMTGGTRLACAAVAGSRCIEASPGAHVPKASVGSVGCCLGGGRSNYCVPSERRLARDASPSL